MTAINYYYIFCGALKVPNVDQFIRLQFWNYTQTLKRTDNFYFLCLEYIWFYDNVYRFFSLFMKKYQNVVCSLDWNFETADTLRFVFFFTFLIIVRLVKNNYTIVRKTSKHFSEEIYVFYQNLDMFNPFYRAYFTWWMIVHI